MIPADVMAHYWAAQEQSLGFLGEVHRPTKVLDEFGGYSFVWTPIATDVPLSVGEGQSNQSQLEQRLGDRIGQRPYFIVTMAHNANVTEDDRIMVISPRFRHFEVLGIPNKDVNLETARRFIVVDVT